MLDDAWAPCNGNNRSSWFFKQCPKSCRIYIYLFFQFLILLPFEKLVSSCLRHGWNIKHLQPKSILRIQKSTHAHQLFSAPGNSFFVWDVKELLCSPSWSSQPGVLRPENKDSFLFSLQTFLYLNFSANITLTHLQCGRPGLHPGLKRCPGEGNGTHCSILAWRMPWTIESMWSQSETAKQAAFTFTPLYQLPQCICRFSSLPGLQS